MFRIDDVAVVDVEVEGVVRVLRVVRVASQRLGPGDDLARVLDDRLARADPCTPLRRTWMRRPPRGATGAAVGACCAVFFIRYIESMGARVCTCACARDQRIVGTAAPASSRCGTKDS